MGAESKHGWGGVHISHAIPPRGAYKLSHEGFSGDPAAPSRSVTKTASSQRGRKQVLHHKDLFFSLSYRTSARAEVSHGNALKRLINIDIYPNPMHA